MSKIKIGITGQAGFVGTHLFNFLGTQDSIERVEFKDEYFQDTKKLETFVSSCDAIVHLAAMNRHNDPQVIYNTNIGLVVQLIAACEKTGSKPHVLFSSSTQEERDNLYGLSKKEGRQLLEQWAERNNAICSGLVIPNVFGPYGLPFYNSFIATFCHQLTHGEQPKIDTDGEVKLIYVGELVDEIWYRIKEPFQNPDIPYFVPHTKTIKVSQVLSLLEGYKTNYIEHGIFPDLSNTFERNLFNTFVCYIDHKNYFPQPLTQHADDRGIFVETSKVGGGQNSFSTTISGITRGNHFHTRKAERFTVIKGKAKLALRKIGSNEVMEFIIDGDKQPGYVDMPIWMTHNITNIGEDMLYTVFWISEHYNPEDEDTYFEKV